MTLLGITNNKAIFRRTAFCQVNFFFYKKVLSEVEVARVAKKL